jgi:branched-chain amino acid transport system ATP-binding protein
MFLKITGLNKSFGALTAVNNVSLGLHQGERVAIIGPNGAGKTTLFNLLTSHISADSGKVIFKGEDLTRLKANEIIRKRVGRSFQIVNIYPNISVFESIQITLFARNRRIYNVFSRAKNLYLEETKKILKEVGLNEFANLPAGFLSHGDKKRLEIGMILANGAELVLLDEPTAGMGVEERISTMSLIKELAEKENLTILFTEHDMSIVFALARRIAVMHQGKIIADGTPEEIRENPKVREVYLGEKK